jgi:UDP-GlcNAc:undecaprenyl-phosphate GlcNAc-1-phosphate transferase
MFSWQLIKPLAVTALLGFITTAFVNKLYRRLHWLDDPLVQTHPKVIHRYPVPRGGGLAIALAIIPAALWFLPLDKHLAGILAGALFLTIVGVLDDIKNLNPYLRLAAGLLAALMVVASGIGVPYISNPFQAGAVINLSSPQIPLYLLGRLRTIWVWSDLMAIIWIVGTMNFVNWSKGVDGQLPGIVTVAGAVIGLLSLKFSGDVTQWPVIILALILAGAYLGFLPWNFYPQKIMPGYGAGSLAGYFLAVLAILSGAKLATAILVLGVPMMDALYSIVRRLLAGKSPVWGDRGHLHHKLMDWGWGKRRIAVFYWSISAVLGLLALKLNSQYKLYTIVLLAVITGGVLLWLNLAAYFLKQPDRDRL